MTTQLHALATNSDNQRVDVSSTALWTSSNPAVATVSSTGLLTGQSMGTATVTASLNTNYYGSITTSIGAPLVTTLQVSPVNSAVYTHGTLQYTATAGYTDNTTGNASANVQWSVSPSATATISPAGLLTATAAGNYTVTATTGTQTAVAGGTIADAPLTSIAVSPANPSFAGGSTQQFTATGLYADKSTANLSKTVVWTSSDTSRLTIDANGLGTAHGNGTPATVTVTAQLASMSATSSARVTSGATLKALVVVPTSSSIAKGSAEPHTAYATYSDGTQQDVTADVNWSVVPVTAASAIHASNIHASRSKAVAAADAPVVTVNQNGMDTAVTPGTTMLQASLGGIQSQTVVIVTPATVTSLSIQATRDLFPVGATQPLQLTGQFSDGSSQDLSWTANWQSSDPTIATIDNSGLVTALKPGSVKFSASFGGLSTSTIGFQVTSANLVSTVIRVPIPSTPVGQRENLSLIGTYSDGTTHDLTQLATWQSSDPTIVSVDGSGTTVAVGIGEAQITAQVAGRTAIAGMSPGPGGLTSIQISPANTKFALGTTQSFTAIGTFSLGNAHTVTADITNDAVWTSLDPGILTIGSHGLAKSGSLGTTKVMASFQGVSQTSDAVQVTNATLTHLSITPGSAKVAQQTSQQYAAIGWFSDGTVQDVSANVAWDTADNTVASIDTTGHGIGMKPGHTQVTAAFQGQMASTPLTVTSATLQSVFLSPGNPEMPLDVLRQFTLTGNFSDGTTQDLTGDAVWLSPVPSINICLLQGQVLGYVPGVGAVTAQMGYFSATTPVNVVDVALTGIALTPASTTIRVQGQQKLTATGTFSDGFTQDLYRNVLFNPDTPSVAAFLSGNGIGYGTGIGNTTVSVALRGITASTGSFQVVSNAASSVAITPANPSLAPGQTQQLTATATYGDGTTADVSATALWVSSNPAALTIDQNGLATSYPVNVPTTNPDGTVSLHPATGPTTVGVSAQAGGTTGNASVTVLPAGSGSTATLVSIAVSPATLSLAKGTSQQFTVTGTYSDGSTRDLTSGAAFTSSNQAVIAVGPNGLATGTGVGSAQVTVSAAGLTATTSSVMVTPATVVSLVVEPTSAHLAAGTPAQLHVVGTYTDGTINDLSTTATWTSLNPTLATVSNAGVVTGVATGLASIQAQLGSLTGTTVMRVSMATLTSVSISPSGSSFAAGATQPFTLTGSFADGSMQDLTAFATWSSSAPSVASVSATGLVTGLTAGPVRFTGTYNGQSATTATVEITPATLVAIAITPSSPTFAKGTQQRLTVTGTYSDGSTHDLTGMATFTSSNPAVFSVSPSGVVLGLSVGTGLVSVSDGALTATTQTVTVTPATLVSIALVPVAPRFAAGTMQQLTAIGTFSDGSTQDLSGQAVWTSSNPQVLTIDAAGLASGMQPGSFQVTASLLGVTATTGTAQVTNATLTALALSPATAAIAKGTAAKFTLTGTFSDGTTQDLSSQAAWASSDGTVVSIDAKGLATGVGTGSAQLTAAFDGLTASTSNFSVNSATLVSIAFNPANPTVATGTNTPVTVTGTFSDGTTQDLSSTATYTSSNPGVVTVNSQGVLTAVGPGTSTITVMAGGVTGSFTVTVANSTATLQQIMVGPAPGAMPHAVRAHTLQADVMRPAIAPSPAPGTSEQYAATGVYSDQSTRDLTTQVAWSSSTPNIATVNSTGLVSFVALGTANIQAAMSGISGSAPVTVVTAPVTLQSIVIGPSAASVAKGGTQQFTATGMYSDGSTQDLTSQVTWQSSVPSVATVNTTGLATSFLGGTTLVSAAFQTVNAMVTLTVSPATLVSLSVTPATATLANGTTQQYKAIGTLTDGSTQDLTTSVTWSSTASNVASVSASGLATATGVGQTTIAAQAGGVTGTAALHVTSAAAVSVQLSPTTVSTPAGTTVQLLATATFTDGTSQNVTAAATYVSSNSAVATVDARGNLKGVGPGSAVVTATLGSASTTLNVTISTVALTSMMVTPSTATLSAGTSQQLTATGTFSDGSTQDLSNSVVWTTSNAHVASVSTTGNVTAAQSGNATVTAASGNISANAAITATSAAVASIAVSPATATIANGQTQQFAATATMTDATQQDVTASAHWSVSDPSKGSVGNGAGSAGFLTSTAPGSLNVVASLDSVSGTAAVTVQAATLSSISIAPNPVTVPAGTTVSLTATGHYSDGSSANLNGSVSWSSANSSLAAVDASGLVHGVSSGSTVVTAALQGTTATTPVTVTTSPLQSIAVSPATLSLALGQHAQLTATGTYADGSTQDITSQVKWTSSAATVGTVSGTGLISTLSVGSTNVSATLNSVSQQLPLTVTAATLQSIAVQASGTSFALGLSLQLKAVGTYSDGTTQDLTSSVAWSSQTPAVGVVNATGLATGVSAGTFNAKASHGGVSGQLSLTVTSAALQSIAITPANTIIVNLLGNQVQYTATGTYSDGTTHNISASVHWAVSNGINLGTISQTGQFSPTAVGLGTITATSGAISGSTNFTVVAVH